MPGTPASSWSVYKARLISLFDGADARVCVAFWLFGLINNVLYVIILSAALDLVGPSIPKASVLLFDVVPSFLTKLTAPYYIHAVPYALRISIFVALSTCGMLLVALTPDSKDGASIRLKMLGVVLASLSSGGGELSFLGLTSFYGRFSLAAWGSGTGGAGLVGAGAYVLATTAFGLSSRASLFAFSFLPLVMLVSFFVVLPRGPMKAAEKSKTGYERIADGHEDGEGAQEGTANASLDEAADMSGRAASPAHSYNSGFGGALRKFKTNLRRAGGLFFPYMLPLLLVYIAEYTINQGVAPTLLFPLAPRSPINRAFQQMI
ncbi:battenin CLN3 protein [Elasticomyces elasticus]|nr:battenin CLN3 protein [Elasticomyces elasticus]